MNSITSNNATNNNNNSMEGKNMNITGNTTAKAVLNAAGKNTFRFINFTLGIDFQKPVIMHYGSGNFTIKKLWDMLPHKNYDYNVAVIVPSKYAYHGNRIATINATGFDITSFYEISIYFDDKNTIPDTYYRKSDFEQDRKNATYYYMIAQRKEYAIPVKKREDCFHNYPFNEYDRYIILNDEYNSSNSMYFRDIQKQGKKQYYSTGSNYYHENDSKYRPVNWFDRSGYFVRDKRETLKNKARALHCEREKTKYLETDTSYQSKAIREQIVNLKAAIIKKLETETSYEKTKPITSLLYWDFEGILYDTELFSKRTAGKEYSSITSSTKAYTNIMEKINKTYNKLNETEGIYYVEF